MKLTITIQCDNAAFTNDDCTEGVDPLKAAKTEVARILTEYITAISQGYPLNRVAIYDINGNKVGNATTLQD